MKITRKQLKQLITEVVQQDKVDLANSALGYISGWQKKGTDVSERASRAHKTVQANKEFDKMRKRGIAVEDKYAKLFLERVTALKHSDKELFDHLKNIGTKIKITTY